MDTIHVKLKTIIDTTHQRGWTPGGIDRKDLYSISVQ